MYPLPTSLHAPLCLATDDVCFETRGVLRSEGAHFGVSAGPRDTFTPNGCDERGLLDLPLCLPTSSRLRSDCNARNVPVKNGNTLDAPGSVSGEVELEQLFRSPLPPFSFSKLVVRHALACIPSPVSRPGGMLADFSSLHLASLPSPLRLPLADFTRKDASMSAPAHHHLCPSRLCPPPHRI